MLEIEMKSGLNPDEYAFLEHRHGWPPRIPYGSRRVYVGLDEDMGYANYWNDIMKAFEENRYGRD